MRCLKIISRTNLPQTTLVIILICNLDVDRLLLLYCQNLQQLLSVVFYSDEIFFNDYLWAMIVQSDLSWL